MVMESFNFSLPAAATLFTLFALSVSFFCFFRFKKCNSIGKKKTVPEAGGAWPLLGHLHHLDGPVPPHLVLSDWANKYGPIFTVKVGVHRAIVVNTWEIAKDCLTTHDRTFASRPKSVGSEVMAYNYAMSGLSPYGPYWREVRKISTVELLSYHRLELLKHVRESEVRASVKDVYERCRDISNSNSNSTPTTLVDMKRWFGDITLNVMFRMIVGKRFNDEEEGDEKARQALRDWFELAGRFVISDGLPFLRWLDLGGHEKAMQRTAKELDRVLQRWLDEHKAKRKLQTGHDQERQNEQDFMDVMLSLLEHNNEGIIHHSYDADTINKATCMNMILAGSDTTTVSSTWALSLLLNNRESLKKVQQELDTNIGRARRVEESDLKDLPYLQAVIKETLRLYPAGPLAVPHEAIEDCTLQGYFVPKGTRILLNLHKIQRDSRVWPDPDEFKPERFLTTEKDFDVRGQNFELIPFGSGRRMCPGISLALSVMGLSLGCFLQAFEVQTPGDEPVDMAEAIGLTNLKATPLEVFVNPRLPESIYLQM